MGSRREAVRTEHKGRDGRAAGGPGCAGLMKGGPPPRSPSTSGLCFMTSGKGCTR